MSTITIYYNNTSIEVYPTNESYRLREIKGNDNITLNFSLPNFIDFPIGSFIIYQSETYTLQELGNFTKISSVNYEYSLVFESQSYNLSKYIFRNTIDNRTKFTLTAQPREFIQHIVDNMNEREPNLWEVGNCLSSSEKTISFSFAKIKQALEDIAITFDTEYEIITIAGVSTINLKKVEYNKDNPLSLSYGKGNGFKSGISRTNETTKPIEVLYVEGGNRNIDSSSYTYTKGDETYHAKELRLPKNTIIYFNGSIFKTQIQYNELTHEQKANYAKYITDADGFSVRVETLNTKRDDALSLTDIYPRHTGTISNVIEIEQVNSNLWNIIDNTNNINYNECMITETTPTIIFQTGMLAGKEFEISAYDNSTKEFKLVSQEIDGIIMPDRQSGYYPQIGDKYIIFNVNLPQQYITDAETELLQNSVKFLHEKRNQTIEFNGELDGIWASQNWENIGGKIKLGGYINFSDTQFCQDGQLIRITAIRESILKPHYPTLTLSNSIISTSFSSELRKADKVEVSLLDENKKNVSFTKRKYADVKETTKMLEDLVLDGFTGAINPISVQAMQMVVGADCFQFDFYNSSYTTKIENQPTISNKRLSMSTSYLLHHTLGITEISNGKAETYKKWTISSYTSSILDDDNKKYYLYARVLKTSTSGVFLLSENSLPFEQTISSTNYYNLLVGILNSADVDGDRSFVSMHGYTEIAPNRITADKFISSDGKTYIDLANGEISAKNGIKFSYSGSVQDVATVMGNVSNTATNAQSTANTANGNATTALTNASTAQSTANSAQSTANSALSNASTAQTTANNAQSTANSALTTASDANSKIDNLKVGNDNLLLNTDFSLGQKYWVSQNVSNIGFYYYQNYNQIYGSTTTAPWGGFYQDVNCKPNETYTVSCRSIFQTVVNNVSIIGVHHLDSSDNILQQSWSNAQNYGNYASNTELTFTTVENCVKIRIFFCKGNTTLTPRVFFGKIKLEYGNKKTEWCPSSHDKDYLMEVLANNTEVIGGAILSSVIQVRNSNNLITAGMNGMNPNSVGKNPRFWAGGDYSNAVASANVADQDEPSATLPILLLDNGWNSNIGEFKVLQHAFALMKNGQAIRFSSENFSSEKSNFAPIPLTNVSYVSDYWSMPNNQATRTVDLIVGNIPRNGNYTMTIPAFSFTTKHNSRVMYQYNANNVKVWLSIEIDLYCGNSFVNLFSSATRCSEFNRGNVTANTLYEQSTSAENHTTTAKTLSGNFSANTNVIIRIKFDLKATDGYSTIYAINNPYTQIAHNAISGTLSENKSVCLISKNGFQIANSSEQSFVFDANGYLDYHGNSSKFNNIEIGKVLGYTSTFSNGYIQVKKYGKVVTVWYSIPYASVNSVGVNSGYRPPYQLNFVAKISDSNDIVRSCYMNSDGVFRCNTIQSGEKLWGQITYITEE